jgi:hypothetical protein
LPLSQVEPLAANVVTHGPQGSRVTPWERARYRRLKPEAGKRQRNGASAAGSGTRSAAAGARPATSRVTLRA